MLRIGMLTSGGDCQALNATMRGVVKGLSANVQELEVYGFYDGYKGLIYGNYRMLSAKDFSGILTKGGTILGTSRQPFKLMRTPDEHGLDKVEAMKQNYYKLRLDCLVILGGNGTQKTANLLREEGLNIIHLPKTIDNDLCGTDHCPGFGSAAKYIGTTFAELERDCHVYATKAVTIVEVMGRDAGWLTAASCLARTNGAKGPDFIYLCEVPFSIDTFLKDVKAKLEEQDAVIIAVSEGVKNKDGRYISEEVQSSAVDSFGHSYIAGAAKVLEDAVRNEIGCKVRSIELNLMQRCAAHLASATDIQESRMLGKTACQYALEGATGMMAAVIRTSDKPYATEFKALPVCDIANAIKSVPADYINDAGNDVTEKMVDYLTPLIQGEMNTVYENGIPKYIYLY